MLLQLNCADGWKRAVHVCGMAAVLMAAAGGVAAAAAAEPEAKPAPKADAPAAEGKKPAEPAGEKAEKAEKAAPKLEIVINAEESPESAAWAEKAKAVCQAYYPKLIEELASDGFVPRSSVTIVMKRKYFAPAAASGGTISVSVPHITGNPGDLGMMVHELAHVIQAYPGQKANLGWLTEGIADYIRFWKYEPQVGQAPINTKTASYRDAYRTTAAFLGWMSDAHDPQIVRKLNARMRKGGCDETIFKDLLGKSVDELWAEFVAAGAPSSPAALAAMKAKAAGAKREAKGETKGESTPADAAKPAAPVK